MEFRLLGPLEVADRDRSLALGGVKQRSLLAVLLLHANEVVSTDRLIDELWGGEPPATAPKSVQVYVSKLRKEIGEGRLVTRAPGYVLRLGGSERDLARFEQLVAEARRAAPEAAARKLREALALWRGPALADLAYEPFAQAEIARLEELRLAVLEQRIDADLAAGRHAELVGELEALAARHPLRERLRCQLMLALYRSARQAEALDAYRAARRELSEELGLEPSEELKRLERAILRQDPAIDCRKPPARRRPRAVPRRP
jgi:DNA-binding SARP family transcriptional activator